MCCDNDYVAVSFNDGVVNDKNTVLVFDKKGELIYNETLLSDVEQLAVCDGYIFIKNVEGVMRIRIKNSSIQQHKCQDGKMLVYDDSTALVCAQAKAGYVEFED